MEKVLLGIRLLVEAALGLLCLIALSQRFSSLVLGFLGMPRLYHPADLQRIHVLLLLGDVLWVVIVLTIGFFCFRDVFKLIRNLRAKHSKP